MHLADGLGGQPELPPVDDGVQNILGDVILDELLADMEFDRPDNTERLYERTLHIVQMTDMLAK